MGDNMDFRNETDDESMDEEETEEKELEEAGMHVDDDEMPSEEE